MKTVLSTAPTIFPISLEDAKDHLRLSGDAEDDYVQSLIYTAIDWAEQFTGRRLLTQTWKYYLDDWPEARDDGSYIRLPFGQLKSVTSVVYTDSDEDDTTWDSDEYIVDIESEPGRVVLGYGYTWPSFTASPSNPICITYVCGWTASASVPTNIKHAIKLMVTDLYNDRETMLFGNLKKLNTIENLLMPQIIHGVYP